MKFTNFHSHTTYSNIRLLDSINQVGDSIDYAHKLGHASLAITDHDCLSSHVKVEQHLAKRRKENPDDESWQNFRVHKGNEIYLVREGLTKDNYVSGTDKYYHFVLVAKDEIGYQQIRKISSRAWERAWYRYMLRVPTYPSDLREVIGSEKGHIIAATACFVAGTKVETNHGWKNIEELTSDDLVINKNGEWEKINFPTSRDYQGDGYEIRFGRSAAPIICTANHQFLTTTLKTKKLKWVSAEELRTQSGNSKHIGVRPIKPNYQNSIILRKEEYLHSFHKNESKYSHRSDITPKEIEITPELMRLFGLFLADGSVVGGVAPRISFSFHEDEFPIYYGSFVEKATKLLSLNWSIERVPKQRKVELSTTAQDVYDLFHYLFGSCNAFTKKIPSRLRINKELDTELAFGYMLGDGYFRIRKGNSTVDYPSGEFATASVSYILSQNFIDLLDDIEIPANIYKQEGQIDKNGISHQDAWYVSGSNICLGEIDKLTPYTHEEVLEIFKKAAYVRRKEYFILDGVKYRKIRIISKKKVFLDEKVYCLNNNTHSFKCENLIVHNCLGGFVGQKILAYGADSANKRKYQEEIADFIEDMVDIFGKENFFLELQPSETEEQIYVNNELLKLGAAFDLKCIITLDAHYLKKEDRQIHKAYLNSKEGEREVDAFYASTYLMSVEEIHEYMDKHIGREKVDELIANTALIDNMCEEYSIRKPFTLPYLPLREWGAPDPKLVAKYSKSLPTLTYFIQSETKSDVDFVTRLLGALEGPHFHRGDGKEDERLARIEEELSILKVSSEAMGLRWSAYLLQVADYIQVLWDSNEMIIGVARGSGAGFYLNYLLGIVQVDPTREKVGMVPWRFLNPERASILDIDFDIPASKRERAIEILRETYGAERVAKVATFQTEKSKSAIQVAVRSLGLEPETGIYLSSMIDSPRGMLNTLEDTFYGNEEKGISANRNFVGEMTQNYPEVWHIATGVQGLVCNSSQHAGGIIITEKPITEYTALMRTNKGELITQMDLHDEEELGNVKIDLLATDALDRIQVCLSLLLKYGYLEDKGSLRANYEHAIGVYNLEREDPAMWKMVWENRIINLFQMEQNSGIQGIALTRPRSVEDLAALNSIIRLMAEEKGAEQPLNKYARFRQNPLLWDREMDEHRLTQQEKDFLHSHLDYEYGICAHQEDIMKIVVSPEAGGMSMLWGDQLRRSIAKKIGGEFERLEEEFFQNAREKNISYNFVDYLWNTLFKTQRGYSFNASHTLSYSLVGLQQMNLAYRYPTIFWNTANLIVDSGAVDSFEEEEDLLESAPVKAVQEDEEEDDEETGATTTRKNKAVNYGKISVAIGRMKARGVSVELPDINRSEITFVPDVEENTIRYGLKGITAISDTLVDTIIANRPYTSLADFLKRVKVNKPQGANLIKAGVFDKLEGRPRESIMRDYLYAISDTKNLLNLRNMLYLIRENLLPEEVAYYGTLFQFNRFLKTRRKGSDYVLEQVDFDFYSQHFEMDLLTNSEDGTYLISAPVWDKLYSKAMEPMRVYLKKNQQVMLNRVNERLIQENADKYANGNRAKWEMDSLSFYFEPHELAHVSPSYNIANFFLLPEEPVPLRDAGFYKGRQTFIYELAYLAGTVIHKDAMKRQVSLLTADGVVTVKVWSAQFTKYDRQISVKGEDGKKKIMERSWFSRGNKLLISGIRRGNNFLPKYYKNGPYPTPFLLIEKIDEDGKLTLRDARYGEEV